MLCQLVVVLRHTSVRDLEIVNVLKNEGALSLVAVFAFDEAQRVITPMSSSIEMVGGMVAIIEAVTVTLCGVSKLAR